MLMLVISGRTLLLIVLLIICLIIGITVSFSIMFNLLIKSNNLGNKTSISDNIVGGFVICESSDSSSASGPSNTIHNPVIREHNWSSDNKSYLKQQDPLSIDDEINSLDLSGIKWHD